MGAKADVCIQHSTDGRCRQKIAAFIGFRSHAAFIPALLAAASAEETCAAGNYCRLISGNLAGKCTDGECVTDVDICKDKATDDRCGAEAGELRGQCQADKTCILAAQDLDEAAIATLKRANITEEEAKKCIAACSRKGFNEKYGISTLNLDYLFDAPKVLCDDVFCFKKNCVEAAFSSFYNSTLKAAEDDCTKWGYSSASGMSAVVATAGVVVVAVLK